jgi:hypothetical protein
VHGGQGLLGTSVAGSDYAEVDPRGLSTFGRREPSQPPAPYATTATLILALLVEILQFMSDRLTLCEDDMLQV